MRLRTTGALRRRVAALSVGLIALTLFPICVARSVHAFFPTNLRTLGGALGKSHEAITSDAIKQLDQEFFGISRLTKPMKKAIEEIADNNINVDDDQNTAYLHVDGESFPEAQSLLFVLFDDLVRALQNKDAGLARERTGRALHTIQDFYSHSNWVELGNGSPNPSLGRRGNPINRLPQNVATCQNCTGGLPPLLCPNCSGNLITSQLTSGYYGGESAPFNVKPAGKCSHGGLTDSSATGFFGEGINKDSFDCEFSPHNTLHSAAASVAGEATKQFFRDIKAAVTPRQLKLLLGVGPTLAIAMDTTGSMGSIIDGVKQQAIQIVNSRLGTNEEPSKYVLAPFNDPGVGPITVTDDPDQFKPAISSLFASGGGDCPELSMTGMLQALGASDKGGDLFMFTDASSKDSSLAGAVSSLATSKDIEVFPILFGSCSPIDPGYIRIANDSGGQLFFLFGSEAGTITQLADLIVRSSAVNVLSIGDTLTGTAKSYDVPVDSTMTRVTFSVSGSTSVIVTRPDGTVVQGTDSGVSLISLSTGRIYSIINPASGQWSVAVNGTGDFSVMVTGESPLDLNAFRFVKPSGRPGHEGFSPITGLPLAGQASTVDARLGDGFSTAQFELRTKAGALLQSFSLTPVTGTVDELAGTLTPPAASFLVYVTGLDSNGTAYRRVLPGIITPQTVQITAPTSQDLRPGQTTTYVFQVKNLGAADTFVFSGSDDRGFLSSISPAVFALATNETRSVTVQLQTPAGAVPGTSDTLTVTVQGIGGSNNFAVVRSAVGLGGNSSPDCTQARASVASLWPPNHQMQSVSILGVIDPDGDPVTIQIDRIMQNEPTNGSGDGDTCPDASGIGGATAQISAERSGNGNGRVYTIFFTATDGRGGSCQSSVQVCVPHDNNGNCVNGGALFDSTLCP